MIKRKDPESYVKPPGISRRDLLKCALGMTIIGGSSSRVLSVAAEDVPPEPDNLDEPTPWQKGDPEPVQMEVPAQEPEQTSTESPPSQPMDDERPAPPGPDYVWVTGYWWWTGGRYVWVTGYWAVPPQTEYVYISGYWAYRSTAWVYVRGGWGRPYTTVVVVYSTPRPVFTVWVILAPTRIVRRHRHWRHYHTRRAHHRAVRRRHSPGSRPGSPGSRPRGPVSSPGGPARTGPRRR